MKRYIIAFILITVMLFGSFGTPTTSRALVGGDNSSFPRGCGMCTLTLSYQINNVIYWMNGAEMDAMESAPMIKNDRTFILIRYVADNLPGVSLGWDGRERKVTVNTPTGKTVELFIDNPIAKVNGVDTQIDPNNSAVMPFIHADRTFLPFRFIGEMLEAKDIKWHADTKTVDLIFQLDENCEWTEPGYIVIQMERTDDIVDVMFTEGCGDDIQTFTVPANLKAVNANDFDNPDQYTIGKYSMGSTSRRKCARFCLDDNKNVILWEAFPDGDCCPEAPCCDWEVIETLEILSLCPGETGTKILSVKNMCGDGTKPIHFTVEAIDDVLVNAKDFELGSDASKEIEVTITMPKDCEPGTTLEYKVKISSDCEEKTREITILVECEDCVVCCDFTIEYGRVPPPVCAGEIFQVGLYLENNCDDNDLIFKLKQHPDTKDKPGFGDIVDIKPREVTVDAGRTEMIKTLCEMPDDCTDGTKYTFKVLIEAYDEKGEKCGFKTIEYSVECKDCSKCCDVDAKVIPELPKSVETGQWVEVTVAYENNCKDSVQVGVSPWIFPKMYVEGQKSFTLEPGESKNAVFAVEMPKKRDKEHKSQYFITYYKIGEECEKKEFDFLLSF